MKLILLLKVPKIPSTENMDNGIQAPMWQRISLSTYSNMIQRGGIHIVLSMEVKPTIHVRTFASRNEEIQNGTYI